MRKPLDFRILLSINFIEQKVLLICIISAGDNREIMYIFRDNGLYAFLSLPLLYLLNHNLPTCGNTNESPYPVSPFGSEG